MNKTVNWLFKHFIINTKQVDNLLKEFDLKFSINNPYTTVYRYSILNK